MQAIRRLVVVMAMAVVCMGAGLALSASPALAGGVDTNNNGLLSAAIYNATPYTWTLVAAYAPGNPPGGSLGNGGWNTAPGSTIQPGGSTLYRLNPWQALSGGICGGYNEYFFDAYITYRVDVLGGPPEYVNLVINGPWNQNYCLNGGHWTDPGFSDYVTATPPPSGYDPSNASGAAPSTLISNPQLTYAHNTPYLYDQSFQAVGNWTIDATANYSSAAMSDVLNSLCANAPNTTCSFTQTGPFTWGIGTPGTPYQASNCAAPGSAASSLTIQYDAAQSATLTIGAGVTLSDEVNLFDVVASSVSVSIEGQHQWQDVQTFTRSSTADVPPHDIASVFVVPVVGKVPGTLVVSNSTATYTITNFGEQRSGVSTSTLAGVDPPQDTLTPAFNVLTKVRPMTAAELSDHCHIGAAMGLGAPSGPPPATLVPEEGMARVELGQTQTQVAQALGRPLGKRFPLNPCRGLNPACYAVRATGGTWSYRNLTVVFGPDLRVSALIYTGPERSKRHVGVGSTLAAVRGAFPRAVCSEQAGRTDCTLTRVHGRWTVKTVFRLTKRSGGRFKCKQVLMYVIRHNRGKVSA